MTNINEDDMSITNSDISIDSNDLENWNPSFPSYTYNEKPPFLRKKSIKPFSMILCASRNQGKSYMIRYLYENHWEKKFDLVMVFSKTLGSGFYDQFIKSKTKYSSFSPEILQKLFALQEEHKKKTSSYLNILCVFDDCLGSNIMYNQEVQDVFTLGRHLGLSVVFATQNPTCVSQTCRQNTTHLVLLRCKGRGLDNILNNFLLDLIDEDELPDHCKRVDVFLRSIIKKVFSIRYRALVIDYDKEGTTFSDCAKTFMVPEIWKPKRRSD